MLQAKSSFNYIENFHALNDVLRLNNLLKFNLGAEIGVRHGVASHFLLSENRDLKTYLIDPYLPYMDAGNYFYDREQQRSIKKLAEARLAEFSDRIIWKILLSIDAAFEVPDESLDYCFIDANHEYHFVKIDIEAWWPKIRPGGVLCGHDYHMEGVSRAVNEFRPIDLHIPWPSDVWFIQK